MQRVDFLSFRETLCMYTTIGQYSDYAMSLLIDNSVRYADMLNDQVSFFIAPYMMPFTGRIITNNILTMESFLNTVMHMVPDPTIPKKPQRDLFLRHVIMMKGFIKILLNRHPKSNSGIYVLFECNCKKYATALRTFNQNTIRNQYIGPLCDDILALFL